MTTELLAEKTLVAPNDMRALILAPFGRDAELLVRVLHQASIAAEACSDISDLCRHIVEGVGIILIAEEALSKEAMPALTSRIDNQEAWSDLPVYVMAQQGSAQSRVRLQQLEPLGNVTILERPLRIETLVSTFRMGLRAREHQYQLRLRLYLEQNSIHALRESEQRYRTLAEAMPQLVWTTDGDGRCDYLSRQWEEYSGLTEKEQLGFAWLDTLHPDDREPAFSAWTAAYQRGAIYDLEFRLRRHDGVYRWFKTRGVPERDETGRIHKWFGSCTDIEEQKKISEERRQLLLMEQKARGLAEMLNRVGPLLQEELEPDKLAQKVIDLATQLLGADYGALYRQTNGLAAELVCSTSEGDDKPLPEQFQGALARMFNGSGVLIWEDPTEQCSFPCHIACGLTSRSGQFMGALHFSSKQKNAFQELHSKLVSGVAAQAAIAIDNARLFAEAQNAQDTLRSSNLELLRANEDLNQFAYSASHDLQEPVRMVSLYGQMLQRQYESVLGQNGREFLTFIIQGARRMEMLLKDLLDYTQITTVGDEDLEAVDANEVLKRALENLRHSIKEASAKITAAILPAVTIREFQLLQLFQNLIGNAIKYRGAEPLHISITAHKSEGGFWQFNIQDNGIGIAPQYTKQIFAIFRRLHANSHYEGTGIGLAICRKIVERRGGRIWVESEGEGMGSKFCFTLPAAD